MKNLLIAFVATAFLLGGCTDDDGADVGSNDKISVSNTEIAVGPEGATTDITISSTGVWRISGVCDWAHPSAITGKNGDKVTFTVDPNTTDVLRETTFKVFTGSAVVPVKITSEIDDVLDLLSDASLTFESASNEFKVKVKTNIADLAYEFSEKGNEWLTFKERIEALGGITILKFTLAENTDYDPRSSELTISGKGKNIQIPITQNQVNSMSVEKTLYEFDLAEQTLSFDVVANVPYKVAIGSNWIQAIPQTRGLETKTLSFKLESATVSRGSTITLSWEGLTPVVITVVQKDPNAETALIPDAAFKSKLASLGYIIDLGGEACIVTDAGKAATTLDCSESNVKSLKGITNFPNLTSLSCNGNPMELIPLGDLAISSIDMSSNYSGAANVVVSGTKIKSLNFYYSSSLKTLDVSDCPALQKLQIEYSYYMTTLYLKTGQTITDLSDDMAGYWSGGYKKVYK